MFGITLLGYFLANNIDLAEDIAGRGIFVFGTLVVVVVGSIVAFLIKTGNRDRLRKAVVRNLGMSFGATTTEQFIQRLPQNHGTRTQFANGTDRTNSSTLNRDAVASADLRGLVYASQAMHDVVTLAVSVAASDAPIMIAGPNGSGKSTQAELLRERLERSGREAAP